MTTTYDTPIAPHEMRSNAGLSGVATGSVLRPRNRTVTPSLTPHARTRAAQMGIPTKLVKRAIQYPDCVYPAGGGRTMSVAGALAVVHLHGVVITVLWNGKEGR